MAPCLEWLSSSTHQAGARAGLLPLTKSLPCTTTVHPISGTPHNAGPSSARWNWRVIDIPAQTMRLAFGSAASLLVATALLGKAAVKGGSIVSQLLAITVTWAMLASPLRAAEPETRILILNATDPYLPAYQVIDAAMRETLANDTTRRFVYFSETLDAQRFDWKQYEPEVLALLAKKYNGLRIDVVVAITQPALDFVIEHGKQLWPGAWVVFHTVPAQALENVSLPERMTGVMSGEDIAGTLDLARQLQPHARRILVIAGASDFDQSLADENSEGTGHAAATGGSRVSARFVAARAC